MRFLTVIVTLLSIRTFCFADDTRVIDAYYRYHIPENTTQTETKATAMERAIAEALANEFSTVVNAETWSDLRNSTDASQVDIWRLGSSVVRGEWLETISGPDYNLITDGNAIAIEVRLRGRVAPLSARTIDLHIATLRGGTDGIYESQRFKSGDRLEVRFGAPVDGSLLLFLDDSEGTVCQLLPFAGQKAGAMAIKAGERYHFFHDTDDSWIEQYQLSTDKELERNTLYVIFTPNHIVKPMTTESNRIRFMSTDSFRDWLSHQRGIDKDLQVRAIPLTILN